MSIQGEQTTQLAEVIYLSSKLENAILPKSLRDKIDLKLKRLRRMARQGQSAGEYEPVAKYIDWCLSIPWGRYVKDNYDLNFAKAVMDSMHYGSEDVKDVVLEYLAVMKRKSELGDNDYTSPVLAFVGVQGSGKTSLARAIATALGRPFYRISLGAVGTSKELRGSPSDDLSGYPGQIVKAIVHSKCLNPVILLDEFDKVSGNESARVDFMAIMLEILDPEQNHNFRDWYIDYPVDLSKILFIATANRFKTISRELLDRLEFIEFPDYSFQDKAIIAKNYLFPKVLDYAGLRSEELVIDDDVWYEIAKEFGKDNGVRRLEQNMQKLARRTVKGISMGLHNNVHITKENVLEHTSKTLPSVEEVRYKDFTLGKDTSANDNVTVTPTKDTP